MSLFTVDSNNILGASVQEAGRYNVKVVKADVGTTGRGDDKMTVDYEVLDGKYKGGQVRYNVMTWLAEDNDKLEKTIKRFNTFAVAIGVKDGAGIDSLQQLAKGAVGKKLTIDVDWGEPNNRGNSYLQAYGYHVLSSEVSEPNGVTRPGADSNQGGNSNPFGNGGGQPTSQATGGMFGGNADSIDISDDDLPFD